MENEEEKEYKYYLRYKENFERGGMDTYEKYKRNMEFSNAQIDHIEYEQDFLGEYFLSKIHIWDKRAKEYIFKEANHWERYKSLWSNPSHKIWIKGRKSVYLYSCVYHFGCAICEFPVKFGDFVLHHKKPYDFEHIFSTGNIVHKKCHNKIHKKERS